MMKTINNDKLLRIDDNLKAKDNAQYYKVQEIIKNNLALKNVNFKVKVSDETDEIEILYKIAEQYDTLQLRMEVFDTINLIVCENFNRAELENIIIVYDYLDEIKIYHEINYPLLENQITFDVLKSLLETMSKQEKFTIISPSNTNMFENSSIKLFFNDSSTLEDTGINYLSKPKKYIQNKYNEFQNEFKEVFQSGRAS